MATSMPSITLGTTASAQELWDMFWEGFKFLNGGIGSSHVSFGGTPRTDSASLGLHESQLRFTSVKGGHDHGGASGTGEGAGHRLHPYGLRHVHFDLDEIPVLWWSFLGSYGGFNVEKTGYNYLLYSGKSSAAMATYGGLTTSATTTLNWQPSAGTSDTVATYDTAYNNFTRVNLLALARPAPVTEGSADDVGLNTSFYIKVDTLSSDTTMGLYVHNWGNSTFTNVYGNALIEQSSIGDTL